MTQSPDAKQIFLDALDHPPAEQQAYVERACAGDATVRNRVLSLLQSHGRRDGVLDHTLSLDPQTIDAITHRNEPPVIAGYALRRILGRGGFGVVWLAEQYEPLRRTVALKLLHPALTGFGAHPSAGSEVVAPFEAERQALAAMDHPNVARVIDAGTVTAGPHAGQPYFAMEFVDGAPITHFCRSQNLDLHLRLELFIKVCSAVQHAHQKGLIHRDLKPGNILVASTDGVAMPKVIDFGVAKAIGDSAELPTGLTQQSQVIGTPQYMSPEQAQGGVGRVDTRSDVYSLGAVLYELLAGAPPFDPAAMRGSSLAEICRYLNDRVPVQPSVRAVEVGLTAPFAPQLRGELDWIVGKALERDPVRRYQSTSDLARDIERHLRHEPVTAGPPSRLYRARKFVRRHRGGVLLSTAAAVMLVVATGISLTQAARARRAEAVALAQTEQTRKELGKFMSMARFSQGILRSIDPAVARGRDPALMLDVLATASQRAQRELSSEPEVAGSVHSMLGYAHGAIGASDKALEHYRHAMTLFRQSLGPDHPDTLKEVGNYFAALTDADRFSEAEQVAGELSAAFDRTGLNQSPDATSFYSNLGSMYFRQKKFDQARSCFERAMAGNRATGATGRETFAVLNNLAAVNFELGDLPGAKEAWERLLERQVSTLGDDHPQTLSTINNLAMLAQETGDLATAEALMIKSLVGKQRIHQPAHPSRLMTEVNVGTFYLEQGRFGDAANILEKSYAECIQRLPPEDERRAVVTLRLAEVRRRLGRPADALPLAVAAYERFRVSQDDSRWLQAIVLQLAIAADQSDPDAAAAALAVCARYLDSAARVSPQLRASLQFHASREARLRGDDAAARTLLDAARRSAESLPAGGIVREEIARYE